MDIHLILTLVSGFCWTLVYLDGIRVGVRDKSYAMPFWALVLNLAWELLYGVEGYLGYGWKPQTIINVIWLLLDVGILYTFIRFAPRQFPYKSLPRTAFIFWTILGLATAFVLQWTVFHEFGFGQGAKYSAFLQNLLMSILFISMLTQRNHTAGQSYTIAINKCLGTLAPTIHLGLIDQGPVSFILFTGGLIFIFDIIYIYLLYRFKQLGHQQAIL